MAVRASRLAAKASVEKVARIELEAGFGGVDVEHAASHRFREARREREAISRPIEDEVVVVASRAAKLLVIGIDATSNRRRKAKIERRTGHRSDRASRHQLAVYRRKLRGMNGELVRQHVIRETPGEIPVRVLRQIHRSRAVGGREVV